MTKVAVEERTDAPEKLPPVRAGFALALLGAAAMSLAQFIWDRDHLTFRFFSYDQIKTVGFWIYVASLLWFAVATVQCHRKRRRWSADWTLALVFHPLFWIVAYSYTNSSSSFDSNGIAPSHQSAPVASKYPPLSFDPPPDWQRVDANENFSFFLPPGMVEVPVQGIDSYVGTFSGDEFDIHFDYGMYSASLDEHPGEWVAIDRFDARIVTIEIQQTQEEFSYYTAVHFPRVRASSQDHLKLTLWSNCKSRADIATAKRIFGTIQIYLN